MPIVPVDTPYSLGSLFSHGLHQGWAFASYRLPGEQLPHTVVQRDPSDASSNGQLSLSKAFVFSPFDTASRWKTLNIIPDIQFRGWDLGGVIDKLPSKLNGYNFSMPTCSLRSISKEVYLSRLGKLISHLRKGADSEKVVLSRPLVHPFSKKPNIGQLYKDLCDQYPGAYVFAFHHPHSGLWMGATPERLIEVRGDVLEMVSLAGTRFGDDLGNWRRKEKEEQSIVTNFLLQVLKKLGIHNVEIEGPFAQKAGQLTHLKTQLKAVLGGTWQLKQILENLHPTPAVCGYPQVQAMDWIRNFEGYDRSFYTGYLGMIHGEEHTDLYVNLRSMQVFEDAAVLYVGGGVTALSKAEEEWEETEAKAETLRKVLKPYIQVHA